MKGTLAIHTFSIIMLISILSNAQGIQLGEVILMSNSPLKEGADTELFQSFLTEANKGWARVSPGTAQFLLQADRGDRNGEFLSVCVVPKIVDRRKLPAGSPFTDKAVMTVAGASLSGRSSDFLSKPAAYTEYQLIGAKEFGSLPAVDLLGIHYIKVKPERARAFEQLVLDKLHPAVGTLARDMKLLYYKAVEGEKKGSFITIYAIKSTAARERFWPTGGPEQDIVKKLFGPHKELALELASYLVDNTYLGPESGGGAAYFESLEWTDYVIVD